MSFRCRISRILQTVAGSWLILFGDTALARNPIVEDWDANREDLSKHGIAFQLSYTASFMEHLHGGLRRGTNWQGLLDFATLVDLEKTIGWHGAYFHAEAIWVQGKYPSSVDYVGNLNEVSNIQGLVPTARVYHVWLQQKLLDDKLRFTLGWMTLDTDFMISDSISLFINSSFGPIQTWNANFSAPIYPVAALGFLADWEINDQYELQMGLYDGDSGGEEGNKRSSNSRLGSDDGVAILIEASRKHQIAGRAGILKLGAGYDTGLTIVNATGELAHGNGHFYGILDQTLLTGKTKDAADRLTFFIRIGQAMSPGRSMVDLAYDVGFTGCGLNPEDQWGVVMTHSRFSRSFVDATLASGSFNTNSETALELTYKAQIFPWLAMQPTLQHLINPQSGAPNATVLGLVMMLSF